MLAHMLTMQRKLDGEIFKAHGLIGYEGISAERLDLALFDEIGELIHEIKSRWCWWKNHQEPEDRKKVLEELVDVVHFVLMKLLKCGAEEVLREPDFVSFIPAGDKLAEFYSGVIRLVDLCYGPLDWQFGLFEMAHALGFTWSEVYEAYKAKNAVNYRRAKEGY